MKKLIPFLLVFCLLLSSCVKIAEKGAGDTGSQSGETKQNTQDNAGDAAQAAQVAELFALYPAYIQMPLGQHVTLDADTAPKGKKLIWSSSNTSVAIVDENGRITPVVLGEAVITCALADDPGILSTCGVLVSDEYELLLWEYAPEPVDEDALMAAMDAALTDAVPNTEWPESWLSDVPKMDGKVDGIFGEGLETPDGLGVSLTVQGVDSVKAYVDKLVSLGFKKEETSAGSDYMATLTGNGYTVNITYTDSTKRCNVRVGE